MNKSSIAAITGLMVGITITIASWVAYSSKAPETILLPIDSQESSILTITLDLNNLVTLKDEVTPTTVNKALKEFYSKFNSKEPIYFFIDTPGGDVESGLVLAQFLKATSQNVICIAKQAQSMGFLLLQSCKVRYVTDATLLMAHELGTGLPAYIILPELRRFVAELEHEQDYLNDIMASRIGITTQELQAKMTPMWITHGGKAAVKLNLADKVVYPICTKELFDSVVGGPLNEIEAQMTGIRALPTEVSGCPL